MASLAFDWFRNRDGDVGILRRNIHWLRHYLSCAGLFDPDPQRLDACAARSAEIYKALNLAHNQISWAYLCDRLEACPLAAEFFLEACAGEGGAAEPVVGYELSRAQMRLLDSQGRTYVNLRVHPIRFLPDYHLALATNSPEIHERAVALGPARGFIDLNVALLKARAARRYSRRLDPDQGCVFFAQTAFDSSRIREGELLDDAFLLAELADYAEREGVANKYFKRHPHEEPTAVLDKGLARQGWISTNTSTYDLLSVEGLRVCALSSSVCHEAHYFGARPTTFFKGADRFPYVGEPSAPGDYVMTPANLHDAEVWRYLFEGGEKPAAEYPRHQTPFRISSNLAWG